MSNGEPEILMPSGERAQTGEYVSQPAKLLRIAAMIRELLEEVRKSSPDEGGRRRLRAIYEKALATLKEGLSEDLQKELQTLTLPLDGTPSESEIRLAQAQLVAACLIASRTSSTALKRQRGCLWSRVSHAGDRDASAVPGMRVAELLARRRDS